MADCVCESTPSCVGLKRGAELENSQSCKRIKAEPLTPPRDYEPCECDEVDGPSSPYWEAEDYMVRGYETEQPVQYNLYDMTAEEWEQHETGEMWELSQNEVPRMDFDVEMT